MKYNHGLAEKQFAAEWKKQRAEYQSAGMSEEMILEMYEYERTVFNSDRRYLEHYEESEFLWEESATNENNERKVTKMRSRYIDSISVSISESNFEDMFGWIESIENEALYAALSRLKREDLELLTLYAMEGYGVTEIAQKQGIAHQNVSKKIKRLKNNLKFL